SESSRAKASSDMAIVKAGIAEINEQKSQADILKALVNRASSFAPRVAFFVIKGDRATGWRGRGFEGTVGDEAIQQITMGMDYDTVVSNAAKSLTTWSGGPGSHADDHMLLNRLGEEPPQRMVAIPLVVRGKAVAILYADSAALDAESINLEALETLVTVSGMAVELLSVSRTAPKKAAEETAAPVAESQPSYEPASEYVEPPTVSAVEPSYSAVEPSYSDTIPTFEPEPTPVQPESLMETVPVDEPAGGFEETPSETANFGEEPPAWAPTPVEEAPAAPRRRYGQDSELPVDVSSEEERRLHNDARRFARLLISEIKLYNEQK